VSQTPFPHFHETHQFVVDTLRSDAPRVLAPYIEKIRRISRELGESHEDVALHLLSDGQLLRRPKVEQRLLIAAFVELQSPDPTSALPESLGNRQSGGTDGGQQSPEKANDRGNYHCGNNKLGGDAEGKGHLTKGLPVDC
jgi:hypothetical protein